MRVQITAKAGYSNPRRGIELPLGAVAEVPDPVAVKLLNMGLAVPAPPAERKTPATKPASEHTAKSKASKSSSPAKEEDE